MERSDWASGINTDAPSAARVYDYFLGGSLNFEVDRRLAARLEQAMPDIGLIMRANRSFLRRAVRFLAGSGICQFLDLGSGIPTVGNVHEIARKVSAGCRVTYVDNDPIAVAHSRAVLAGDDHHSVIEADLRDPDRVLAEVRTRRLLDLDQPVALLLVGVLHQLAGDVSPVIRGYRAAMAPGSHLVLSQASADHRPEAREFRSTYNSGYGPGADMTLRTRDEVLALFDGFDLVEPGLVQLTEWRPEDPDDVGEDPHRLSTYAGVGLRR